MRIQPWPRPLGCLVAAALFLVGPASVCRAGLVPLPWDLSRPFIEGAKGTLAYDAKTQDFQASLVPLVYVLPPQYVLFSGSAKETIDLRVDHQGQFVSNGGGFTLTGALDLDGDGHPDVSGPQPLLTGTITAFGADAAGPPTIAFDGLFTITGGLLTQPVSLTGGGTLSAPFTVGASGGFLLNAETVQRGTLADFSKDFSSTTVKPLTGQVIVPEPPAWALALAGAVFLAMAGFRSKSPCSSTIC
ncbi:MAG TPA: hypothetical protein VFA18_18910 [Gemmataceae bacterium]|nr:hypothetical protein [Gemmataceae bacterium]